MTVRVEGEAAIRVNDKEAGLKLQNLEKEARRLRNELTQVRKQPLIDKKKEKELKKALDTANKDMKDLKRNTEDVSKVMDDLSGSSLRDLERAYRKLNREASRLNRNTDEFAAKKKQIQAIKTEMDNTRKSMRAAGNEQSRWGKAVSGTKNLASQLLPAFGFTAMIGGAALLVNEFIRLREEIIQNRLQVQRLTGETGDSLVKLTSRIKATADTFNKDFNETLIAANAFAKQMDISLEEALDKINLGFALGADVSGEFLDQLKEYGPQFKAAGLSADQAITIITQSVKEGVFSDKGADAIKEATLSLREMTKATNDALKGIGLSGDQIQKQISDGTITVFEAIQMISARLAKLPPQSKEVGTAIADIFKGAGEDAGLDFIKTLANVKGGLDDMKKGATDAELAMLDMVDANEKLNNALDRLVGKTSGSFNNIIAQVKLLTAGGINLLIDTWDKFKDRIEVTYILISKFFGFIDSQAKKVTNGISTIAESITSKFTTFFGIAEEETKKQVEKTSEYTNQLAKDAAEGWIEQFKKIEDKPVTQKVVIETETKSSTGTTTNAQTKGKSQQTPTAIRQAMETLDALKPIMADQVDLFATSEAMKQKLGEETTNKLINLSNRLNKKQEENIEKTNKATADDYAYLFGELGNLFGQFGETQKLAALAQIATDTARAISSLTASSEANPANAVTAGGAGAIQFAAGLIRIFANIAQAKQILSEADQYFTGRYPVIGSQDGKQYNVPYRGNLKTGYLPKGAALFNEKGTEAVITHEDLQNPVVAINYQRIMDAVNGTRVIQHAEGRMPAQSTAGNEMSREMFNMLNTALSMLTERLKSIEENGIYAINDIHQIDKDLTEINTRKANASA